MKTQLIIASVFAAFAGACLYLYHAEYFVLLVPSHVQIIAESTDRYTRRTPVYFKRLERWQQETKDVLWDAQEPIIEHLVQQLLDVLYEEKLIPHRTRVEFALKNVSGSIVHVQLDRSPLSNGAIAANINAIHSILATLARNNVQVAGVQLLINNEPLMDQHLDFSSPWQLQCVPT